METIWEKIIRHKEIYQFYGLEVPPYRITGVEHRMLKDEIFASFEKKDEIVLYCDGVQLEHVMRLTDY